MNQQTNESLRQLEAIAANPSTPPDFLAQMAGNEKVHIREIVATNPSTPARAIKQLAEDQNLSVRVAVGRNPATPADTLGLLAADSECDVRCAVATNPRTPASALEKLANDWVAWVVDAVLRNPSTPTSVLGRFSANTTKQPANSAARKTEIKYSIVTIGGNNVISARIFDFVGYSEATWLTEIKEWAAGEEYGEIMRRKQQAYLDLKSQIYASYNDAEQAILAIAKIEKETECAKKQRSEKRG